MVAAGIGIFLLGFVFAFGITGFAIYPHEDAFGYRYPQIMTPWLIIAAATEIGALDPNLGSELVEARFELEVGDDFSGELVGVSSCARDPGEQAIFKKVTNIEPVPLEVDGIDYVGASLVRSRRRFVWKQVSRVSRILEGPV